MQQNIPFTGQASPGVTPPAGVESDTQLPATGSYHGSTDSDSPLVTWTLPARIGPYELVEELARGGMGVVYRARHTGLDRLVALKTMRLEALTEKENAVRFEREVRAAARLSHPNIVPIYEVGQHQGLPYYTMALVPGGSFVNHRESLHDDPDRALMLMEKVCRAVHYAHEQGIVHRDLKPGNILLDQHGEPLVADFGLARLRDSFDLTHTGAVLGTPGFMAPEQAEGRSRDVGPASDIWALGVILYYLLTGRRPFSGDNDDVRRQVLATNPPSPRALSPGLSRDLERVVMKCLEKDPYCRYPSAAALADDLARCRRGEPPTHVRISLPARARSLVRRHPRWAALSIAAMLLAVILPASLRYFDPDRPANEMRNQLAQGEKVTLIGPQGGPRWSKWVIGQGAVVPSANLDGTFCLQTFQPAYLELLPGPLPGRYRFRAEIRQKTNLSNDVGIYFARVRQGAEPGPVHCFLRLSSNQQPAIPKIVPKARRQVELFTCRVPEVEQHGNPDYFASTGVFNTFAAETAEMTWDTLDVIVTPTSARVLWKNKPAQDRAFADCVQDGRLGLHDWNVPDLELNSEGSLGLYVSQGVAWFRNVSVVAD